MRKLIVMLVSIVLMCVTSNTSAANTENLKVVHQANTVIELDSKGEKLNDISDSILSRLYFDNIVYTSNSVRIDGHVEYHNKVFPFQLEGDLYRSRHSNKMIIGKLKDKAGNFSVLHFSIDARNSNDNGLLFDSQKAIEKGNLLRLYLLQQDRTLTIAEIIEPQFPFVSLSVDETTVKDLDIAPFEEENWYVKVIEPISLELVENDEIIETDWSVLNTTQTVTRNRTYSLNYKVLGENVYEYMRVSHYVSYQDRPPGDNPWYVKMEVLRKWTTSTIPDWNGEDSNMRIGKYSDSRIRAKTSENEAFTQQGWAASYTRDGTIKFMINWREWTSSLGPVSFGVLWTGARQETVGTTINHNNGTTFVRTAQNTYENMILDRVGQYYDATFKVGRFNSGTGAKEVFVEFLYDISNIQDYSYGGNQIETISRFYYVR